ncbi:MAG: membrane dipeptidase, partial [Desulfuromonadales bacterium]|nr:membrane dipeptidase [Desulfuromonadales bacterium]
MVKITSGLRSLVIAVCFMLSGIAGPATAAPLIYGYADLHAHQFANLGLGGLLVWGAPFSPDDDPQKALPYSDFMNVDPTFNILFPLIDPINPYVTNDVLGLLDLAAPVIPLPPIPYRPGWSTAFLPLVSPLPMYPAVAIHGPNGLADLLNLALTEKAGHKVGGYPEFDGWPAYDVMTAQQMYYQWLERSWQGGQRLMVMLAVNNKTLCSAAYHRADFGCEDMPAIERQIQAAKELEAFIDNKDDGSINGSGWYRIVYSAEQARAAASAGKLAVVLGVETPALLGCTVPAAARGECTEQTVRDGVQHLYNIGVRHVYPVHNADNAFGGTALYKDLFDINSAVYNEGQWMLAGACPQNSDGDLGNDIRYHSDLRDKIYLFQSGVNTALDEFDPLTRTLLDLAGIATTPVSAAPAGANCNPRGLTELGQVLIDELVSHKMVIDADHTSTVTFNDILTRLETHAYPAVTLGHASLVEMGRDRGVESETNRNERNKDITQMKRVRNLGGTLAVILEPDDTEHVIEYTKDGQPPIVPFLCSESSESWAQQYLAVREIMGPDGAIALGSDFNGLAGWPAPRFGDKQCNGHPPDPYYPEDHVPASFAVHGRPTEPELTSYTFGEKTYDYNVDGLAHVGLLPDFIQDLIGLASSDSTFIEPLFKSAAAYIQSWEGIDAANLKITSISSPPSYAAAESGFVVVDITGNLGRSATGSTTVTRFFLSADAEFSADDIVIGERTVPALNSKAGFDAETQVSIPASALSGAYYHLIACADATRMVPESSEYDNCLVSQDTIQIGEPDLVVTGISTDPAPPVPGQSVAVSLAIKNQGSADAGSFSASFYKNDRYNCELVCQSWGCVRPCYPAVKTPDFTCSSPGVLEAGATVICSGTAIYEAGSFAAYADVDNDNTVLESNEDNNIFGPQGITIISGPDLIIQE